MHRRVGDVELPVGVKHQGHHVGFGAAVEIPGVAEAVNVPALLKQTTAPTWRTHPVRIADHAVSLDVGSLELVGELGRVLEELEDAVFQLALLAGGHIFTMFPDRPRRILLTQGPPPVGL